MDVPAEILFVASADLATGLTDAFAGAAWLVAGFVAWRRRPDSAAGPAMILVGVLWFPPGLRFADSDVVSDVGWALSGAPAWIFLAYLLVAFPHMRLQGHVDRVVIGLAVFATTVGWWAQLGALNDLVIYAAAALAIARLVTRWLHSSGPTRRAVAPVLWAGVALLGGLIGLFAGVVPGDFYTLLVAAVPLAFLFGLLRTRLTRSNLGGLAAELSVLPEGAQLRDALARALGDPGLEVAFPAPPPRTGYVDGVGDRFSPPADAAVTEVPGATGVAAILVHDPSLREDEGLLDGVAAVARLALDNARLRAEVRAQLTEVRASRQRIVEATSAERRRIERDLHDGVQQRLLTLGLDLRMLAESIEDDEGANRAQRAAAEAETAVQELRELARGIHPPVLVQEGLEPAVHALAERAALPVTVDVDLPSGRMAPAVEAAAYFAASECIANAIKHSSARRVDLRLRLCDGMLDLTIAEDGCGGARFVGGGGLAGVRDRIDALGGSVVVESPADCGTRVEIRLPG